MQLYLKYQLSCASNRTSAKKKFPPTQLPCILLSLNHDRGGNDVKVTFFGAPSNLHKVRHWALESPQAAIDHAYKLSASEAFNKNYYQSNRPVVDGQFLKAGVRLASILNEVFQ